MLIPYKTICQKYNVGATGVLHIGAHWAEEAKDYYTNGVTKSIWVEADPESVEIASNVLSIYPNTQLITACCTDKDGVLVHFNRSNNQGQSSSILALEHHKVAHPEVMYIDTISLCTTRIDSLLTPLDLKGFRFVNMDIQGAELLALKGMGKLLEIPEFLYLEVNKLPLYTGCALIEEIDDYVAKFGFKRVETAWCGNTGWGDALYIRKK